MRICLARAQIRGKSCHGRAGAQHRDRGPVCPDRRCHGATQAVCRSLVFKITVELLRLGRGSGGGQIVVVVVVVVIGRVAAAAATQQQWMLGHTYNIRLILNASRRPPRPCCTHMCRIGSKSSSQSVQGLAFVQVLCIEARHFVTFSIFGFGLEPGVDRNLQRRGGGGGLGGKFVGSHRVRAGGPFSGGHWGGDEEVGNRGNPYRNL